MFDTYALSSALSQRERETEREKVGMLFEAKVRRAFIGAETRASRSRA
jgi:hypothetical protein